MNKKGKVSAINENYLIKVVFNDMDNNVSAWLPVLNNQSYEVNDIVVCAFFSSNLTDGVILGKIGGV